MSTAIALKIAPSNIYILFSTRHNFFLSLNRKFQLNFHLDFKRHDKKLMHNTIHSRVNKLISIAITTKSTTPSKFRIAVANYNEIWYTITHINQPCKKQT